MSSATEGIRNRKGGEQREPLQPGEAIQAEDMYEGVVYPNGERMYENTFINAGMFDYPPLLKWKYVPETVKKEMKEYVGSYISRQYEGGIPNQVIYVPFHAHPVYEKKKGWCGTRKIVKYAVLYKHAILEYMKENKMMDRPFTLLGENHHPKRWVIQYVYMPTSS